ncbi:S28 family serine protease [Pendulispora albinea]|uniref:Secreted tripeptidyl aminopeptidase n=1 Tax=Pendulispora albinea TaxID=2741071 RepID=A0ABZ2LNF6_9BACT
MRSYVAYTAVSLFLLGAAGCSGDPTNSAASNDPGASESQLEASKAVDILDRLKAIPDFTSVQEVAPGQVANARKFIIKISQPLDHSRPLGGRFEQRFALWHVSEQAPVVLYSGGYELREILSDVQPVIKSNQISMEYRYYGESVPSPLTPDQWKYLTVEQSAHDFHHVVSLLKSIYAGKWISHGRSKGGMTQIAYRTFYPEDVDGTVAIVTPLQTEFMGPRYPEWFRSLESRFPQCTANKVGFEREVLKRRDVIAKKTLAEAKEAGETFTKLPIQKAIELGIKDFHFGFYLGANPLTDCNDFVGASATDDELYAAYDNWVGKFSYSDQGIQRYDPRAYIYQGCAEMGIYQIDETPLADLLRYPKEQPFCYFLPDGTNPTYNPLSSRLTVHYLKSEAQRMVFVYGSTDAWSGQSVQYPGVEDAHKFWITEGPSTGHVVHFTSLKGADWTKASTRVQTWAGLLPGATAATAAPEAVAPKAEIGAASADEEVLWPPKLYFRNRARKNAH